MVVAFAGMLVVLAATDYLSGLAHPPAATQTDGNHIRIVAAVPQD